MAAMAFFWDIYWTISVFQFQPMTKWKLPSMGINSAAGSPWRHGTS